MRSSLTILGIVIGVAAVITMVTLGGGATEQVTSDVASLGSNLLEVRPGQGGPGPGGPRMTGEVFNVEDAEAIAREISGPAAVAPNASLTMSAILGNENWSTSVIGSTNDYLYVRKGSLQSGRRFSDSELRAGRAVCLLGDTVRKELFGGQESLGASIRGSLLRPSCFPVQWVWFSAISRIERPPVWIRSKRCATNSAGSLRKGCGFR